jgi:excisionase family DNA binding protein
MCNATGGQVGQAGVIAHAVERCLAPILEKLSEANAELTRLKKMVEQVASAQEKLNEALARPRQEYLSLDEVSVITGRSKKHISRLVQAGKLPASDIGLGDTACYCISRADLSAFMQQSRSGGRVPPPAEQDQLVERYLPKLKRSA